MNARLAELDAKLAAVARRLEDLAGAFAQHGETLGIAIEVLRTIYDEEAQNRLRLHELRRSADYQLAYDDSDPLVSVVIPTYNRPELLCGFDTVGAGADASEHRDHRRRRRLPT